MGSYKYTTQVTVVDYRHGANDQILKKLVED
ncbi:unnamed protein product, partial [marine sediment metagenome]